MMALWRQVPRIRAERQLDAAQAAGYPYMEAGSRAAFIDRIMEQLREGYSTAERALFSLNGLVMSARSFKAHMRKLLGGGFSE